MKILFRVDASYQIGTGHIIRCLTLANEAKQKGWISRIILREPAAHIVELIESHGHEVKGFVSSTQAKIKRVNNTAHGHWLSVSQEADAMAFLEVVNEFQPDWIIVDHYALDATWLCIVKKSITKILVLDDLGDRDLICDLLLDQNLGADAEKYDGRAPGNPTLLLGPSFALLRREFREWRERSLKERLARTVENVLITMGGVDAKDYTLRVLKELTKSKYAKNCMFTVIIGGSYPHINSLDDFVNSSELKVTLLSNVKNMAEIMSRSDLCVGAAGSTSWERCCMGLPTITLAIADNQIEIAEELCRINVAIYSNINNLRDNFEQFFGESGEDLIRTLSMNSRKVCDGFGASRVIEELEKSLENRNS